MQDLFFSPSIVWKSPYRRIYLIWAIIMLLGFTLPFQDYQWWVLTPIGIIAMFYNVPQQLPQVKWIIWLWVAIAGLGTIFSALEYRALIPSFIVVFHYGSYWMMYLGIGQLISGLIMKNWFHSILGIAWLVFAVVFWAPLWMDSYTLFYVIAAVTSLPYFYIAFKK